ncbi:MAG: VOC family protein [Verrucomicrobia bacterium]|nr:VOC family protein [Verrucomicrobiota bacterium]
MALKTMGLVWIVVKDLKKAVDFYTEIVGMKLQEIQEQWGWAELEGPEGGSRLGIAQMSPECGDKLKPGQNAVMTFTVESLAESVEEMSKKGAELVGAVEEVPGHVRMQTMLDTDGNLFQLVELLDCCG